MADPSEKQTTQVIEDEMWIYSTLRGVINSNRPVVIKPNSHNTLQLHTHTYKNTIQLHSLYTHCSTSSHHKVTYDTEDTTPLKGRTVEVADTLHSRFCSAKVKRREETSSQPCPYQKVQLAYCDIALEVFLKENIFPDNRRHVCS